MKKITIGLDGMSCGMCEAHVQDTIRSSFQVESVKASHKNKDVIIIASSDISDEEIHTALDPTGYEIKSINREDYIKKSLFGRK